MMISFFVYFKNKLKNIFLRLFIFCCLNDDNEEEFILKINKKIYVDEKRNVF